MAEVFDIFLVCAPGLENTVRDEAAARGFTEPKVSAGGVTITGGWTDVWRANLEMRTVTRVLARIGSFMAFHLAQLDKRARKFAFDAVLRPDVPVKVEVVCVKSKIYHAGAATQRIETALRESHGMTVAADAPVTLKVRIDDNRVMLSVDTSGESLHKRGHKQGVGKAPMRETLAAAFLAQCGYTPGMSLVDPMCGSGTFPIEAAEISMGHQAGRSRDFAFMELAGFDAGLMQDLRVAPQDYDQSSFCVGYDRDQGAIRMATENAVRAGVAAATSFDCQTADKLVAPALPPGLVMVNPPYGGRIGQKKLLYALYAALGQRLKSEFAGWRVGVVTTEHGLAKAMGLPFAPPGPPIPHGGLKVRLYQTGPL